MLHRSIPVTCAVPMLRSALRVFVLTELAEKRDRGFAKSVRKKVVRYRGHHTL